MEEKGVHQRQMILYTASVAAEGEAIPTHKKAPKAVASAAKSIPIAETNALSSSEQKGKQQHHKEHKEKKRKSTDEASNDGSKKKKKVSRVCFNSLIR